jgi:hypothetical protein
MASINEVPVHAEVIEEYSGIVRKADAWTNGKRVVIELLRDGRSMGYKTDYQRVECRFLVMRVEQDSGKFKSHAKQYSGARLKKALEDWVCWKRDLLPHLELDANPAQYRFTS